MALVALEVNGVALVGATSQGVLFNEPGVALVEKRRVRFGREAAAEARLNPGRSYENYWELLSDEPLPRTARGFEATLTWRTDSCRICESVLSSRKAELTASFLWFPQALGTSVWRCFWE